MARRSGGLFSTSSGVLIGKSAYIQPNVKSRGLVVFNRTSSSQLPSSCTTSTGSETCLSNRQYLRPSTQGSYKVQYFQSPLDPVRIAQSQIFRVLPPADPCGVCGGNGSTCAGCDGKPNSGMKPDLCGLCGGANSCVGCDGVPYSGKRTDVCGVCMGNNSTCIGCDGLPRSDGGAVRDSCGVCGGDDRSCSLPPSFGLLPSKLGYACQGKEMRVWWKAPTNRSGSDHIVVCRCVYVCK